MLNIWLLQFLVVMCFIQVFESIPVSQRVSLSGDELQSTFYDLSLSFLPVSRVVQSTATTIALFSVSFHERKTVKPTIKPTTASPIQITSLSWQPDISARMSLSHFSLSEEVFHISLSRSTPTVKPGNHPTVVPTMNSPTEISGGVVSFLKESLRFSTRTLPTASPTVSGGKLSVKVGSGQQLTTVSEIHSLKGPVSLSVASLSSCFNFIASSDISALSFYTSSSMRTLSGRITSVSRSRLVTGLPTEKPSSAPLRVTSIAVPTQQPSPLPTMLISTRTDTSSNLACYSSALPAPEPTTSPHDTVNRQPTYGPSAIPTVLSTISATSYPTEISHPAPTIFPSGEISLSPTTEPSVLAGLSAAPVTGPTMEPSGVPYREATLYPAALPTIEPAQLLSFQPTFVSTRTCDPSVSPTEVMTFNPMVASLSIPTAFPTEAVATDSSRHPSASPSDSPSVEPSLGSAPSTSLLSSSPSARPSVSPSDAYTPFPTREPSRQPSMYPSEYPEPAAEATIGPNTNGPTSGPAVAPSLNLKLQPSASPSTYPSEVLTSEPTSQYSVQPILDVTWLPTPVVVLMPSPAPTVILIPSSDPADTPSIQPAASSSLKPSILTPTCYPTSSPEPTSESTLSRPSFDRTRYPSSEPSSKPSNATTDVGSSPTIEPTEGYSMRFVSFGLSIVTSTPPTILPTIVPTVTPTVMFTTLESSTLCPTVASSADPTPALSVTPIASPTPLPTTSPTPFPTVYPTPSPSSVNPTPIPTVSPTPSPSTRTPTIYLSPTALPSPKPTIDRTPYQYSAVYKQYSQRVASFGQLLSSLLFSSFSYQGSLITGDCGDYQGFMSSSTLNLPFSAMYFSEITLVAYMYDYTLQFNRLDSKFSCSSRASLSSIVQAIESRSGHVVVCDGHTWRVLNCSSSNGNPVVSLCVDCDASCPTDGCSNGAPTDDDSDMLYSVTSSSCNACKKYSQASYFLVSLQYLEDALYPQIPTALSVIPSKRSVHIAANVSAVGMLFCAALAGNRTLESAQTIQRMGTGTAVKSPGWVSLDIGHLVPDTAYDIYCYTQDATGSYLMPLTDVTARVAHTRTLCCRSILIPTLYTHVTESSASVVSSWPINVLSLEALPTTGNLLVSLQLTPFNCSLSNTSSLIPAANAVPPSLQFASSANSMTSKSFIIVGAPGCYTLLASGSGDDTYNNFTKSIYIRNTATPPNPPSLLSAQFSNDGLKLIVSLDSASDRGATTIFNYLASFSCSMVLNFRGANTSSCVWATSRLIVAVVYSFVSVLIVDMWIQRASLFMLVPRRLRYFRRLLCPRLL
jgi:hypothetical protein